MQPQGHTQVMLNMLHKGFNPQNALDVPRFCISAGMPPETSSPSSGPGTGGAAEQAASAGDINSEVFFEEGFDPEVVKRLGEMGHQVGTTKGECIE